MIYKDKLNLYFALKMLISSITSGMKQECYPLESWKLKVYCALIGKDLTSSHEAEKSKKGKRFLRGILRMGRSPAGRKGTGVPDKEVSFSKIPVIKRPVLL